MTRYPEMRYKQDILRVQLYDFAKTGPRIRGFLHELNVKMIELFDIPLTVTCLHRSFDANRHVGGVRSSKHLILVDKNGEVIAPCEGSDMRSRVLKPEQIEELREWATWNFADLFWKDKSHGTGPHIHVHFERVAIQHTPENFRAL